MEAAAMGRPAIATDVTGCRDVVSSGRTGLLCKAQDSESLAQACVEMVEQGWEQTDAMARRAREVAREQFDDRIIIDIYRTLIADVII
jgi:glycosyltransferase involved in cell wall biosynthesis